MSGENLDPLKVKAARQEEMNYLTNKGVYVKVAREEVTKRKAKLVKVRWVDVNKGDSIKTDYRSRLVAMEFRNGTDNRQ